MKLPLPARLKNWIRYCLKWFGYHKEFYSCYYVQKGICFYFNNKVHTCCYYGYIKENGTICDVNDSHLERKIRTKRRELFAAHRRGVSLGCMDCPCFKKDQWQQSDRIQHVVLNHFVSCNLNCVHCGYMKMDVKDTKHEHVLRAIKELFDSGGIRAGASFDIGGGEPSIQRGLDPIIEFILLKGSSIHINTNGTHYVDLYARGCLNGVISLTLTPDAGSRDVYLAIKGADYCAQVWQNIAHYVSSTGGKAEVKIILEAGNIADIGNMIDQLAAAKVKRFVVDMDLTIKPEDREKYRQSIRLLVDGAAERAISAIKGHHLPRELW